MYYAKLYSSDKQIEMRVGRDVVPNSVPLHVVQRGSLPDDVLYVANLIIRERVRVVIVIGVLVRTICADRPTRPQPTTAVTCQSTAAITCQILKL